MSMIMHKQNASLSAPQPSSEGMLVETDASHNSVIIVAFAHVEVYGKAAGDWELAATILADEKVTFVSLEQYEEVYFYSQTGSEEVLRYFFVEDSATAPSIEGNKINSIDDVGDVPSFDASFAGKVLSVDAQGNLAWITR